MNPSSSAQATLTPESTAVLGKEVKLPAIDRELRVLFAEDSGISRASLLNLVVYSEDAASVERDTPIIQELTRETACRALLIISLPGGEPSVRAWVQAHCNLTTGGGKAVCTEQVSFVIRGATPAYVRSSIFAHLDSDLPVVFWWHGDLSSAFEESLVSRIDRLIVDSSSWPDPRDGFRKLFAAIEWEGSQFVAHDLAFTRLGPVCSAVAVAFDDSQVLERTGRIEKIRIVCATPRRIEGLFLASWFACRLGLTFVSGDLEDSHFEFQNGEGKKAASVEIDVAYRDKESIGQPILEVVIETDDGKVTLNPSPDDAFFRTCVDLPHRKECQELLPIRKCDDGSLMAAVLGRAGQNRQFPGTVAILRELLDSEAE